MPHQTLLISLGFAGCIVLGPLSAKADYVKNAPGKTVCSDGTTAAAVNPNFRANYKVWQCPKSRKHQRADPARVL
jgi:hypothetical protein